MDYENEEAKRAAEAMSRFLNGYGIRVEDVVEYLARDHRTIQQRVTKFAVAWLERCAKMQTDGEFDGRNAASAELGKKFVERTTGQERAMPFI
jgi:hypothetical protein